MKYSYIHLIIYHLWGFFPPHYSSGVKYLWQKLHGPQNPKYLLLDTLQKMFATSVLEYPLVFFVVVLFLIWFQFSIEILQYFIHFVHHSFSYWNIFILIILKTLTTVSNNWIIFRCASTVIFLFIYSHIFLTCLMSNFLKIIF